MSHKVIDIEGIGITYAEKLNVLGIFTTSELLEQGGTKNGREKIATATGIPESLILTWVNHADLFRVSGVGGQFAELLEAAGVDSVKELALRRADSLHTKLLDTNNQFGLSGKVPSIDTLQVMIDEAKKLDRKVHH